MSHRALDKKSNMDFLEEMGWKKFLPQSVIDNVQVSGTWIAEWTWFCACKRSDPDRSLCLVMLSNKDSFARYFCPAIFSCIFYFSCHHRSFYGVFAVSHYVAISYIRFWDQREILFILKFNKSAPKAFLVFNILFYFISHYFHKSNLKPKGISFFIITMCTKLKKYRNNLGLTFRGVS